MCCFVAAAVVACVVLVVLDVVVLVLVLVVLVVLVLVDIVACVVAVVVDVIVDNCCSHMNSCPYYRVRRSISHLPWSVFKARLLDSQEGATTERRV